MPQAYQKKAKYLQRENVSERFVQKGTLREDLRNERVLAEALDESEDVNPSDDGAEQALDELASHVRVFPV